MYQGYENKFNSILPDVIFLRSSEQGGFSK